MEVQFLKGWKYLETMMIGREGFRSPEDVPKLPEPGNYFLAEGLRWGWDSSDFECALREVVELTEKEVSPKVYDLLTHFGKNWNAGELVKIPSQLVKVSEALNDEVVEALLKPETAGWDSQTFSNNLDNLQNWSYYDFEAEGGYGVKMLNPTGGFPHKLLETFLQRYEFQKPGVYWLVWDKEFDEAKLDSLSEKSINLENQLKKSVFPSNASREECMKAYLDAIEKVKGLVEPEDKISYVPVSKEMNSLLTYLITEYRVKGDRVFLFEKSPFQTSVLRYGEPTKAERLQDAKRNRYKNIRCSTVNLEGKNRRELGYWKNWPEDILDKLFEKELSFWAHGSLLYLPDISETCFETSYQSQPDFFSKKYQIIIQVVDPIDNF